MDAIVYDKEKKHLQVIELKYKLPIESTSDLINLDAMLNKAYNQIKIAEEMVEGNKTFILEEYFGESFKGIIPDFVDYFVITNGTSDSQVRALVDNVEEKMHKAGYELKEQEGNNSGTWVLLDYGDIIIHIFDRENRQFYNLERIWNDGKKIDDVNEF